MAFPLDAPQIINADISALNHVDEVRMRAARLPAYARELRDGEALLPFVIWPALKVKVATSWRSMEASLVPCRAPKLGATIAAMISERPNLMLS
eukprot:CAMPEP_0202811490 /NCGR_PEP_ID=MMETSP1389-20130828/3342_1 /ASSEMBLY_ACC=CAM_ASM_000865 /TAXON_ID=302021 /ORGANISM="Rhodomonas sp., Strain CCMP768" /LENGTH=93 /DNA_ID=CAMNT_0049482635 /DNA_START=548 /DNA_END=826 /DNA_ORIENTATION=-